MEKSIIAKKLKKIISVMGCASLLIMTGSVVTVRKMRPRSQLR